MASAVPALSFDRTFDPQTGSPVSVADGITRITAPNASAYTFTGTNSFLLGHERLAVLDPGPDDPVHLAALADAIGGRPAMAPVSAVRCAGSSGPGSSTASRSWPRRKLLVPVKV